MSRLCLIPAKAASTRLKKKNLRQLGEHSLLGHAILKAKKSELFDEICISTESSEVADEAKRYGASVPFLRPSELSVDPATLIDVMLHALDYYRENHIVFDTITLLLPTTPLMSLDDLRGAVDKHADSGGLTVMSVTEYEHAIYNAWSISNDELQTLEPCFPDSPYKFTKSTECPKAYRANGGILVTDIGNLVEHKTYRNKPITPYVMPLDRSADIDTEFDFSLAEFFFQRGTHDWL